MENRLKSFEKRSRKLKEGNKNLIKENDFLKSLVKEQQEDAKTREKELEQLKKGSKGVEKDKAKLEAKISELEIEVISLRRQVAEANELRNENEESADISQSMMPCLNIVKVLVQFVMLAHVMVTVRVGRGMLAYD